MILDDGGDATLLVHKGVEFEKAGAVPDPGQRRQRRVPDHPRAAAALAGARIRSASREIAEQIKGVTEETTTGVHRLYQFAEQRRAAVPGDQRQRLGHQVEVRQQVRLPPLADRRHQPRHRRADRRQGRRRLRLRRRRQGLRGVAARPGRPRDRHRDRPDLRPAGGDGRLPGRHGSRTSSAAPTSSSPPPATRTSSPPQHMAQMKHQAIVGNIGHFDNEIDMAGLSEARRASTRINIKPQVDEWTLRGRPLDHRALRGPAAEPRQRHRPPELRDVATRSPTR